MTPKQFNPDELDRLAAKEVAKLKAQGRMPSLQEFLAAIGEARQRVQAELKRQRSDRTE